jgi:hypothetical protein
MSGGIEHLHCFESSCSDNAEREHLKAARRVAQKEQKSEQGEGAEPLQRHGRGRDRAMFNWGKSYDNKGH